MFREIRPVELLIVVGVILLIFGSAKLPQIGRSMGQGIREFKEGISGGKGNKNGPAEETQAVVIEHKTDKQRVTH